MVTNERLYQPTNDERGEIKEPLRDIDLELPSHRVRSARLGE